MSLSLFQRFYFFRTGLYLGCSVACSTQSFSIANTAQNNPKCTWYSFKWMLNRMLITEFTKVALSFNFWSMCLNRIINYQLNHTFWMFSFFRCSAAVSNVRKKDLNAICVVAYHLNTNSLYKTTWAMLLASALIPLHTVPHRHNVCLCVK